MMLSPVLPSSSFGVSGLVWGRGEWLWEMVEVWGGGRGQARSWPMEAASLLPGGETAAKGEGNFLE